MNTTPNNTVNILKEEINSKLRALQYICGLVCIISSTILLTFF